MKRFLLLLIGATAILSSCQKLPPFEDLSSNFVVVSTYDSTANFKTYSTFAISDYIRKVTNDKNDTMWNNANAKAIIQKVVDNMVAKGYTQVAPLNPTKHLAIQLYALKNTTIYTIPPGYWWGGGWGCYWGYCGGYPWYPYYYTTAISTGTLLIEMADFKNASNGKVAVIWNATGNGQINAGNSSADPFVLDQCLKTVDQSFKQSPYLTNK